MGSKNSGKRKWCWKAVAYPKDRSLVGLYPDELIIYADSPEQLLRKLLKRNRHFWYGTDTLELTRAKGTPDEEMLAVIKGVSHEHEN
jgi:hypothetical protein